MSEDSQDQAGARPLVAVVDDDPHIRAALQRFLTTAGYQVVELESGRQILELESPAPDVICLDVGLGPGMDGLEALRRLRAASPDVPVIMVTGATELDTAVEAMKAGAYDYITKPVDRERLKHAVGRASQMHALLRQVRVLEEDRRASGALAGLIGDSPAMQEVARQVERVVNSNVTVCVFGASGTGKELVARAIHNRGRRSKGRFEALNCAAIPGSLQESELFGHERGAFTGATQGHRGRFEEAHGGTLFLDELGEMSAETQATLLRTLQEMTIRRVGGSKDIPVDVRILCATHKDLQAEVEAGRFREDLYFRVMVYPIRLPTLAERSTDIPALIGHFMGELRTDIGHDITGVSPEALDALMAYHWPGNVRELRNVMHRAMLASTSEEVGVGDLPSPIRQILLPSLPPTISQAPPCSSPQLANAAADDEVTPLGELERREIIKALRVTDGSVAKAAKLLGIGRATLYRRIGKLGLTHSSDELV